MLKSPFSLTPFQRVVFFSATIGFLIGIIGNPTWHHAVEGAQAVSGIVSYPHPTPFYIYQIKAWTLLHQIPAILMHLGLNEIQLSYLLSGLSAMISFMALSLCAFAFTKEVIFSLAIPFLISYTRLISYGPCYPIILTGITASYGVFGQGWMLLSLALLSLRRYKAAGFLLGIFPAIHAALAVQTYGILFLVILFWDRSLLKSLRIPFCIGAAAAALSFAGNLVFTPQLYLPEFPAVSKQLLCDFIRYWDSHRMPVPWNDSGLWINAFVIAISLTALLKHRSELPEDSWVLLRVSAVAGIMGFVAVVLSKFPLEWTPFWITRLMPSRILNLNILIFFIMTVGILKSRTGILPQTMALFSLIYIPVIAKYESQLTHQAVCFICMVTLIILLNTWKKDNAPQPAKQWLYRAFRIVQTFVLCFLMLKLSWKDFVYGPEMRAGFIDWSNDAFFEKTKEGKGILLLGPDLSAIQLVTRRPILIDGGALDIISYLPELALPMSQILQDIYGIDLFNPPASTEHVAILPQELNQALWEARSPEEWKELKAKYHFSEILTSRWNLKLPKAAENESFILYQVP